MIEAAILLSGIFAIGVFIWELGFSLEVRDHSHYEYKHKKKITKKRPPLIFA